MPGGRRITPQDKDLEARALVEMAKLAMPLKDEDIPDWAKRPSVH